MITSVAPSMVTHVARLMGVYDAGRVAIARTAHGSAEPARYSARFSEAQMRHWAQRGHEVLVHQTHQDDWVVLDVLQSSEPDHEPVTLHCQAIQFGEGEARIWLEGRTLFVRGFHIDARARGEHRITGATLNLG